MRQRINAGFTLAELLICLLILGEIATFTIPKILTSQQSQRYNAGAKDVISMVSGAYQQYQAAMGGSVPTTATMKDLSPYMNYLAVDTTGVIDGLPSSGTATVSCSSTLVCLKLHNGMKALLWGNSPFNTTTSYVDMYLDPEGYSSGSQTSLYITLYYNGRIKTYGDSNPSYNPSWFSW